MSEPFFTPAQLSTLTKLDAPKLAEAVRRGYIPKPTAEGYPQEKTIRGAFDFFAAITAETRKEFEDATKGARSMQVGSMAEAASQFGIPLGRLKYAKKNGCNAFHRNGKVNVKVFLEWIFAQGESAETQLPAGFPTWAEVKNMHEAARSKIRLDLERDKVMDFATGKQQASEAVGFFFGELERLEAELPPVLKGGEEVQICETLKKSFLQVREASREKFDKIGSKV